MQDARADYSGYILRKCVGWENAVKRIVTNDDWYIPRGCAGQEQKRKEGGTVLYKLSPESKEAIERIINNGHKAEIGVENREIVVVDIHRKRIYPPKKEKFACNPRA